MAMQPALLSIAERDVDLAHADVDRHVYTCLCHCPRIGLCRLKP